MRRRPRLAEVYTTLIASRAGEPRLVDAVASIASQSMSCAVVVIITDADDEMDGHLQRRCREVHHGVTVVMQSGRGMIRALNTGLSMVQTPYVAFLDADDIWRPLKQQLQIEMMEADRTLDATTCLAVNVWDVGSAAPRESAPTPAAMFTATTFRTTTFARFGGIDESASHYTWLYRWWGKARANGIRTKTLGYQGIERRIHGGNSWMQDGQTAHRDLLAELRRHLREKEVTKA